MTKSAFAQQEKLRLTDLRNWHYRLPRAQVRKQPMKRQPLRLVPVAVQGSGGTTPRIGPVVVDIQALQIAVGAGADPAMVAELVSAIRKRTC